MQSACSIQGAPHESALPGSARETSARVPHPFPQIKHAPYLRVVAQRPGVSPVKHCCHCCASVQLHVFPPPNFALTQPQPQPQPRPCWDAEQRRSWCLLLCRTSAGEAPFVFLIRWSLGDQATSPADQLQGLENDKGGIARIGAHCGRCGS